MWRFLLRFYFQHSISTLSAKVQNFDIMLKVSQNAGTSASNYQNTEVSALSALVLVKGKVVPAETAETDLQKAEGTTLQFYFELLKLQKLLLIVSQLFAEIFADT